MKILKSGTPTEQAPWQRSQIAETFANVRVSASSYRHAENIFGVTVVVAELKFRQVQRQILLAHIVVRADDSALEQRPEAFHVVGMDNPAYVLALAMIYGFVRQILPTVEISIA